MTNRAAVGVCCAVFLLLLPYRAHAQWQWIGPPGGLLGGFAQDPSNPNTLYAVPQASPASLFKSTDHGQHWARMSSVGVYPYGMCIHPTSPLTLYVVGGSIRRSTNGGSSWSVCEHPCILLFDGSCSAAGQPLDTPCSRLPIRPGSPDATPCSSEEYKRRS